MNTRVTGISKIIQTQPIAGPPQGLYLNCVVAIQTTLSPYKLLEKLQKVEFQLGRVRTVKNAPRTIDLDILCYGDYRIQEEALCIPHPRMLEREFVMKPLGEIAPQVALALKQGKSSPKQKRRIKKR